MENQPISYPIENKIASSSGEESSEEGESGSSEYSGEDSDSEIINENNTNNTNKSYEINNQPIPVNNTYIPPIQNHNPINQVNSYQNNQSNKIIIFYYYLMVNGRKILLNLFLIKIIHPRKILTMIMRKVMRNKKKRKSNRNQIVEDHKDQGKLQKDFL